MGLKVAEESQRQGREQGSPEVWNRASRVEAELGTSAHMGVYASNERERQASPPHLILRRREEPGWKLQPKEGTREGALGAENRAGDGHPSLNSCPRGGRSRDGQEAQHVVPVPPPRPLPTLQLRPFL